MFSNYTKVTGNFNIITELLQLNIITNDTRSIILQLLVVVNRVFEKRSLTKTTKGCIIVFEGDKLCL